jgi:hypothetical protein
MTYGPYTTPHQLKVPNNLQILPLCGISLKYIDLQEDKEYLNLNVTGKRGSEDIFERERKNDFNLGCETP